VSDLESSFCNLVVNYRLSIIFAVIFAALFLAEKINIHTALGVALMATGAIIISLI